MGEWVAVETVPELDVRPKSAARVKAEKSVSEFAKSSDTCWRIIYDGWEPGCYGDVEKEMNGMAQMLRTVIRVNGLNIRVSKRKDAIYMLKQD